MRLPLRQILASTEMKTFFQPRMDTDGHGSGDTNSHELNSRVGGGFNSFPFVEFVSKNFSSVFVRVHPWLKTKLSAWLVLSLFLSAVSGASAQLAPAEDFFHGGARHYLSNNIPAALQTVTNGLQLYPEDEKLKKLHELLNQQQQQNQQDQKDQKQDKQDEQKQDQKKDEKKQDEKKDQQSKDEQKKKGEEKKKQEAKDKKEQEKKDPQQAKPDEKKESGDPKPVEAHAMTPQEAKQMLDAQKGDEQVLLFKPEADPKRQDKKLKDW